MTYTWLVLKKSCWGKKGDVIEVDMPVTAYDDFKAKNSTLLERYIGAAPALGRFGVSATRLPNVFKDRMKQIRDNYPGARGMLSGAAGGKFNYDLGEH